jgi:hypothetical protein
MKQRQRKPVVPRPAEETLRRAISELILDEPLFAIRQRKERDA